MIGLLSRPVGGVKDPQPGGVLNPRQVWDNDRRMREAIDRLTAELNMGGMSAYQAQGYGVKSDGVTDDGAALNRLIGNASNSGGGFIQLPPGTTMVSAANKLQILSGVFLIGSGKGVTTLKRTSGSGTSNEILRIGNGSVTQTYCGLGNMTVHGNRSSTTRSGTAPMARINKASDVHIWGVEFCYSPLQNWASTYADHVWCWDIHSHDCNTDGFSFYDNCTDGHVCGYTGERTGDDGFALVSYDTGECQRWTLSDITLNACGLNDGTGTMQGGGFKLAGCKYVTAVNVVTNGCADGTLIQSNETKLASHITVLGLNSSLDGQAASGANRNGLNIVSESSHIHVQGIIDAATHHGCLLNSGTDITLDLDVSNCAQDGILLSNTGAVARVVIRGRSYLNSRNGYNVNGATQVELVGCQALNNNVGGNAATSGNSSGLTLQSGATDITVTGGSYSDTGAATQQNGICFQTGTVTAVTLDNCRATGNLSLPIRQTVTCVSPKRFVGVVGYQTGGFDILNDTDGVREVIGAGTPEGNAASAIGGTCHRTDGGAGTSLYVKESIPTTTTGWVGK